MATRFESFRTLSGPRPEFVGVVEIGKVDAVEAGVGGDEGRDDLGVDFVADVGLAFEGDHVGDAGAWVMMTGGDVAQREE